jgi:glucose dehydrogenase
MRRYKELKWIGGVGLVVLTLAGCGPHRAERDTQAPVEEWPSYGNDAGSSRYSPLTEITKSNLRYLQVAWVYHTGVV